MADSEINSIGFTTLYQPEDEVDITVDIIFVHGLGGHSHETWSELETLSQDLVCWPRDLVPTVCPTARVLTWGYDTTVTEGYFRNSKQNNVSQHGRNLLYDLVLERVSCIKRPIMWVAHSLGGIILQQALVMASTSDVTKPIVRSTAGIMFFGTPQNGGTTPVKAIFKALGLQSDDPMLDVLGYSASDLGHCRSSFAKAWDKHGFKVKVFYEITQHNGTFLVPFQSSIFSDPREDTRALEGNHFQICRFTERSYSWMSIIAKDLRYFHILSQALRGDSGVNVRGISGQTALHMAAIRSDVASARMLVSELRADVNLRDDADRTPLHEAARYGFVAIASTLIKHGAGITIKDQKGQTPLHEASQHGRLDMAALLIEEGADYDASDNHGVTPLLYAMEKGHESIVQLLERARDERDGTTTEEEPSHDEYNDMDDDLYDDLDNINSVIENIPSTTISNLSHTDSRRESGSLANPIIELNEKRGSNPESAVDEQSSQSISEEPDERELLLELLPTDIADIVSVLPITDVWVSGDQDISMFNTAKLWVETKTQHTWIWWPLARPKRPLQEGEVRIFWRCACGTTLWQEASDVEGELFHRLALNHMARDYCDLPTHDDYKYRPKGQDAKNPPISQHMFDVMFNSCDIGCNRMLPHDCFQPPGGMDQLERIPKRVRSFQRDMTVEIWGLSTVHDVSFAYVSFYHCVMVIGPLVFYACWMETFPQDLQNASVPISLVLGALSMFWSSCGILTSKKMD
ncbi:hypothetical protein PGQ11_005506 [Apiospora arundinis]|uniref:Uncharacterized protein n=1 Tax=Apiospora arundinis TaxID=335852 RepID=A0ABR2JB06_9PEZI